MKTFKTYISEEKNTHMRHLDDLVIYGGVNGARQAIFALRDLRDMLSSKKKGTISIKWDGAPSLFAGTDPSDGKFFVAKKGIFNKNPKVYKTNADVDADTTGDLATKLKLALQYLPAIGIKGVIQGDFLFSANDIKQSNIAGEPYTTFHPNTIVYAVPHRDKEAVKKIKDAKIGIVWHTTYHGNSFEEMKASYGVDVKALRQNKNVFQVDAMLRDMSKFTMTERETKEVNDLLSRAGKIFNQISGNALRQLEAHDILSTHIETFNNSFVRDGTVVKDTGRHVEHLIKWIEARYKKEMDKRSTDKGKAAQQSKLDAILDFFSHANKKALKLIFDLQKVLILAKLKLINTFNRLKSIGTFVKTADGYKVTGHEGYVAIDQLGGGAVKVIDRMEFSFNNFSKDTIRGWEKT